MKKATLKLLGMVVLLAVFVVSCIKEDFNSSQELSAPNVEELVGEAALTGSDIIPGKYVIVLRDEAVTPELLDKSLPYENRQELMDQYARAFLGKHRVSTDKLGFVYGVALRGFSAALSPEEVKALSNDPAVKYLEPDRIATIQGGPPGGGGGGGGGQTTPCGISRVGGPANGVGKTAWILDTGIDLDHPDLNVDVGRSTSFVDNNPDDKNGHGTHVAGTIAAINNSVGVVGVAAGATVVAVKVLGNGGSGSYSGIIAGVDYVAGAAGNGDAANMSLGGSAYQPLDDAVIAAAQGGVKFAIAAGNSSAHAGNYSPARANHANIYTVSAMNCSDQWASFSNYGNPPVDFCAPGVSVYSTYKGGGYTSLSGTSMAAPHVAGILLMGSVKQSGNVTGDPDGNPDKIASL
jgi:subtilisin family serine protease